MSYPIDYYYIISINERYLYLQLRTDFNYLLLNLILTELAIAGLAIPVDAIASFQLGWKMGWLMCQIVGFSMTFLGEWLTFSTL